MWLWFVVDSAVSFLAGVAVCWIYKNKVIADIKNGVSKL